MNDSASQVELAAFLSAPDHVVAAVAPATVIYAPAGTLRHAALAGVAHTDDYPRWILPQLVATIGMFVRLGVQHLIIPTLGPSQLKEPGVYGERIADWIVEGLLGPSMLETYQQAGWRTRLMAPAARALPAIAAAQERLMHVGPPAGAPTVWWYLLSDDAEPWQELLAVARQSDAQTQQELIRGLYGEDVPTATLLIGGGKFQVGTRLFPPVLLSPTLQCYWTPRAGISLTEPMLRRILYDCVYARATARADRRARYAQVERQRAIWETTAVLGVGTQVDGFWYPEGIGGAPALSDTTPRELPIGDDGTVRKDGW